MTIRKLALAGAAALLACGAAWGQQVNPLLLRPDPNELLDAVSSAGCERSETADFVRFYCEEAGAFWYFTHEGRPEHPGYHVMSATEPTPTGSNRVDRIPELLIPDQMAGRSGTFGFGRGGFGVSPEAYRAWTKVIFEAWKTDAARMQRSKRDRGKLYPLEPQ